MAAVWPAVEALLAGLHGQPATRSGLLDAAVASAVAMLERQGRSELAETLHAAHAGPRRGAAARWLRRVVGHAGARGRTRTRHEQVLGAVLAALDAACRRLLAGGEADGGVAAFYRDRLGRIDRSCCVPEPPLPRFKGLPANLFADSRFLESHPKDATKGHLLEREALARGLSVLRLSGGSFIATDPGGRRLNFKWSRSPITSAVALGICSHKEATRALLARHGLPVARGRVFHSDDRDRVRDYAAQIGYPVVCKPAAGLRGIGVVTDIRDEAELDAALELHARCPLGRDDLIIERHVAGTDYRIVVVGGQVVSAVCRETASITGTGTHTVADLLLHKNRIRQGNPHLRMRQIVVDDAMMYQLARATLTLDSIPEAGRRVFLANSNNLSRGGDSIEVLDELHPTIRDVAIRAVGAVPGLGFCGLDIMLEDHTRPIDGQRAAIIELNAHGAIGSGQYPMWGTPRNVARAFLLECARHQGLEIAPAPADTLAVRLTVRGRVTRVGYRAWLADEARTFGVAGWVRNADRSTVEALLEGEVAPVAALVNAAVRGPARAVPFWVAAKPMPRQGLGGFRVRR